LLSAGSHQPPTALRLFRQVRTNQVRGCGKLPGRHLNSLPTLCISARIVRRAPLTSRTIERGELRRAYPPITALLPGDDMEVEVWCFLSAEDPVVLERKYSEGPIRLDERLSDSLGRDHDGPAFLGRKIEQRRDMPTRDDATLANLELPGVDHGERVFAFLDDLPSFFAARHTKVTRISYWKFDQLPSPIQTAGRRKNDCARGSPTDSHGADGRYTSGAGLNSPDAYSPRPSLAQATASAWCSHGSGWVMGGRATAALHGSLPVRRYSSSRA